MKKLRCGVIGLGMGNAHANAYRRHPNAILAAVADLSEARLKQAETNLPEAARYTDALKMIAKEKLDVVSVATPNKFHSRFTIAALRAGCHVLCEKPMAMNAGEARAMLAAARKARRRLMINFSFRFTDQSMALKREVEAGTLGEVYFGRTVWHRRRGMPGFGGWFGTKALAGGGPLIDLGVHRLDLALWLMGYPRPVWVMGNAYNKIAGPIAKREGKKFDVEDLAAALVRFDNGAMLEVEASWALNIAEREFMETRLYGTRGGLVQRNLDEGYNFQAELFVERNGVQYDMRPHAPVPGVRDAYSHFIDCIVANKPHMATGEEGLTVMKLLDAIYASARLGRPMRIAK